MLRLPLFLLVLLLHLPSQDLLAQKKAPEDNGVGIFSTRSEYIEFMGNVKKVAYGPEGSPELQAMVPMLNDIALNKPIGFSAGKYNSQASTVGMLSNEEIRKEIEMVDSQYQQLKDMNSKIQKRVAQEIRAIDFTDARSVTSRIQGIRNQARKDLDALLLPHQIKRLRQLHFQSQIRRKNLVDVITDEPLKSDLAITDSQVEILRKEKEKIEQELQEEIRKLQDKARQKLLSKLQPDQKRQVTNLIGDSFDFSRIQQRNTSTPKPGKYRKSR